MYSQFFRLDQAPFSIAPDPRYLFMSERHREALAHLLYGVGSGGGFVLLTGEIGAGKTTICRCFLEQIPVNCNVAYIFNPKQTVDELLKSICDEFGIASMHAGPGQSTAKDFVDALNAHLLISYAEGRNNVLIIDEAQNLSADVLEQLRLLTNLETNERKLLQIILIGQPELRAMLARPELEQLAQRVIARYHLDSLSEAETGGYIRHRLAVAGLVAESPFPQKLMRRIHRLTQGVPRRINLLSDRALLGAYAEGKRMVNRAILTKAAREVFDTGNAGAPLRPSRSGLRSRYALPVLLLVATLAGAAGWMQHSGRYDWTSAWNGMVRAGSQPANIREQTSESAQKEAGAVSQSPAASAAFAAAADISGLLNPESRDENAGYRDLAKLWNVTLADGDPCVAAENADLHCYRGSGGLAEIRQLDRPALLRLNDAQGVAHHALLTGLTSVGATLRAGGVTHNVSLLALGRSFGGDFTTFWHAPNAYRVPLRVGDRGAGVDWLAAQLAKMNSQPAPAPDQLFNEEMAMRVREFQSALGLEADGIVGPKTMMHLNGIAGIAEPRLQHAAPVLSAAMER